MAKADPFNPECPSQEILALIGSKWSMLLMCILQNGPTRSGELARRAGGISQKMLTQTLRELARHGLVQRRDYREVPPRVEYSLTRLGVSLSDLIRQIESWVTANYTRMSSVARNHADANRAS
ncbi:MAG TPA: helix-turn-helix domain-containing protein [Steroidobacteraceae bacterium]|jgi:DNA-binding HxlR family transcriptional regulator|nr:helix-turn-helix domain-containing protein [Steroidobacteraceae bacterium]